MTKPEALAALHAALADCQAAGIIIQIGPLYHAGFGIVAITLEDVIIQDGKLAPRPSPK